MRRALMLLLASALALPAVASGETRTLHFKGETVEAPASWPVFRLSERPQMCVRLDRKAVYLGSPGSEQRCPVGAMGRRRAILVDPAARAEASRVRPVRVSAASKFTGLGFDACTAPSRRSMSAWKASPYRAIGVYIGGSNRGCSQPNLTASWVSAQVAAGWRLIPTYVGLQAPTSSCSSCATLSPGSASLQGAAAASDAVNEARLVGIGTGSPIYFDMESYTRTSSATNATLTFLAAWTKRIRALGYESGVYSSSASGIADLVSRLRTPYSQPDHLWFANWNGRANALDPYIPASAWDDHQRIHQYRGGHNETWGGVTINIDNNYVEGGTAGSGAPSGDDPKGSFDEVNSPAPGQVQVKGWAFDPNGPRKQVEIHAYLGEGAGPRGATRYELGAAELEREDVADEYPRAGSPHGFDFSFPVVGSGRQRVCVYALDIGAGSDRLLGCRHVGIPVPVTLSAIEADPRGLRVTIRCEWPVGTDCPGQAMLRTRVRKRQRVRRRGRPAIRTRVVRRSIGKRRFRLKGGRSHSFRVALGSGGRKLARTRRRLRADLVVAIPGGKTARSVRLK